MQEIAADYIARRMQSSAVGDLNRRRVWIGMRVRRIWIGRSDPDVMATKPLDQIAFGCDRPFLKMRHQPVRIRENKVCNIGFAEFLGPLSGADEACNHNPKSRRRIAG